MQQKIGQKLSQDIYVDCKEKEREEEKKLIQKYFTFILFFF